ncbi:MAG: hypothetical protein ACFFAO_15385 [Candidatus Hermodarchaeota archaeon]
MIELESKSENEFLENLNYQICRSNGFYTKLPEFHKRLADLDYKLNKQETMMILKNNFESKRRRDIFRVILNELDDLVEKSKTKI